MGLLHALPLASWLLEDRRQVASRSSNIEKRNQRCGTTFNNVFPR